MNCWWQGSACSAQVQALYKLPTFCPRGKSSCWFDQRAGSVTACLFLNWHRWSAGKPSRGRLLGMKRFTAPVLRLGETQTWAAARRMRPAPSATRLPGAVHSRPEHHSTRRGQQPCCRIVCLLHCCAARRTARRLVAQQHLAVPTPPAADDLALKSHLPCSQKRKPTAQIYRNRNTLLQWLPYSRGMHL